jgi:hypothetical protein
MADPARSTTPSTATTIDPPTLSTLVWTCTVVQTTAPSIVGRHGGSSAIVAEAAWVTGPISDPMIATSTWST